MAIKVVKSAGRALAVLEFFAFVRRPAGALEVGKALAMPQSSTSMLMRSLIELGYLEQVPGTRLYRPTLRVAVLGDWIDGGAPPGPLTERLEALQRAVQETVLLGRRQGPNVQFISILLPERHVQFYLRAQSLQPLTLSASGRALLSTMPASSAVRIIRRNNAEARAAEHRVDETALLRELDRIRADGVSETQTQFGGPQDFHVIARPLLRPTGGEPVAIAVAGPCQRIMPRRDEIVAALSAWTRNS